MASVQSQLSVIASIHSCCSSSSSSSSSFSSTTTTTTSLVPVGKWPQYGRRISGDRRLQLRRSLCQAMVQQAVPGAPAAYAKEMERLSAKESLLLAVSLGNFIIFFIYDSLNIYDYYQLKEKLIALCTD
ncbi:hypothetical protein CerSpe_194430 [Prunus speciosa]